MLAVMMALRRWMLVHGRGCGAVSANLEAAEKLAEECLLLPVILDPAHEAERKGTGLFPLS